VGRVVEIGWHTCVQAIPGMVFASDTKTWKVLGGCRAVDSLEPITFVMGGNAFSLGPRQYIIQVRRSRPAACQPFPSSAATASCQPCLGATLMKHNLLSMQACHLHWR
jgi:hypothetical protein